MSWSVPITTESGDVRTRPGVGDHPGAGVSSTGFLRARRTERDLGKVWRRLVQHGLLTAAQVLVSFGTPEDTTRVIAAIQQDGTSWCGPTQWQGRTAMRISVSSWATTEADVDRSLEAMLRIAAGRELSPANQFPTASL